ncbi:MAG: type I DNA topoisomerase [Acidobacteriota bacterium]|jgi:DNA topoisomerase-1|nr:type I DNA topoisomerase [Acidobacteriota bacterium]
MGKALVVVESPAKAKTIGKYLGRNYIVKASVGHIKDLPKSKLGVDVEDGFAPQIVVIPGKAKVIKELKTAAKGVSDIYLAADPDREGEAICQHLSDELAGKSKNVYRVLFHEITKPAIQDAFKHPGQINANKVDAQLTRRILDRLVGYKVSQLLWKKVRYGLSAGRVQTVALRLIVEREQEIKAFQSEEYWTLDARLLGKLPPEFTARARQLDGKKWAVADQATSDAVVAGLRGERFVIESIRRREKKKFPVPPFITSKLQQDAARRLNYTVKRTMALAQRLYEGIDIGPEGSVGLITYMRTDSTRVSETALGEVRELIRTQYGEDYLPKHPIYYKAGKAAQEAHEAIRPTSVARTPESLKNVLEPELWKLYALIWTRFVASQMNPAVFDQTEVNIKAGRVDFRATGSIMKFVGFLAVYQESKAGRDDGAPDEKGGAKDADEETALPELHEGEELALQALAPAQHFTQPPPRYNEAALVKALESRGIGRPSTYASILSTIQNREYVDKREGKFYPTATGEAVLEWLVKNFKELFDYEYTARMEDDLDRIESGREARGKALGTFYTGFAGDLDKAQGAPGLKDEVEETDEVCEKCGGKMVIKWGRFGKFMACANYPECKNTREIGTSGADGEGAGAPEIEEIACEKCGKPMVLKRGRFGEFMACSGYPECKNTKKIVKSAESVTVKQDIPLEEACPACGKNLVIKHGRFGEFTACSNYPDCKYIKHKGTDVRCPKEGCTGEIVERKSRRGKVFYGCSNYPDCDFVLWNLPVPEPCPLCGAKFTIQKTTKRDGTVRYCNNEDCDFKESVDQP